MVGGEIEPRNHACIQGMYFATDPQDQSLILVYTMIWDKLLDLSEPASSSATSDRCKQQTIFVWVTGEQVELLAQNHAHKYYFITA